MWVNSDTSYEAVLNDGTTRLVGDLELGVLDNIGGTTTPFATTAIEEIAAGVYSAVRISPDAGGQYSLIWKLVSTGEIRGVDDLTVTSTTFSPGEPGPAYATVDELFRVLKVRQPTADQTAAAQGDLDTATIEINAEIDWATDHAPADAGQLELMNGVCIDRAADLWRHRESAPGILGVVDEAVPSSFGRYSWERYAQRLAPLKAQWGIA